LIVQLIVSQSDAIIGKAGRKYVPFYGTFFFFILLSNLMGLLPGFAPPTGNLNTTIGLALVSFIGYNVIAVREMGSAYIKEFIGPMTSLPGSNFISKLAFFAGPATFRMFLFYPGEFLPRLSPGVVIFASVWQHDGRP